MSSPPPLASPTRPTSELGSSDDEPDEDWLEELREQDAENQRWLPPFLRSNQATATTAFTLPQASTTSSQHPPSASRTSTSSHASSRTSPIQQRPPQSDKTPIESRQDSDEEEEDEDDGGEAEGQGEGEGEFKGSDEVQGGSKDTSRGTSGESSPGKENMDYSSNT
ncbi:hypothetical protein JCM5353_001175, partial [Sporobolomyces roseus]